MRLDGQIPTFVAGELSTLLKGRSDVEKFHAAGERVDNFIVLHQGPLVRRHGTQLLGAVPYKEEEGRTWNNSEVSWDDADFPWSLGLAWDALTMSWDEADFPWGSSRSWNDISVPWDEAFFPWNDSDVASYVQGQPSLYTFSVSATRSLPIMFIGGRILVDPRGLNDIGSPPEVLASPTGGAYLAGSSITLTASFSSANTLQWFFNDAPIAGATGSSYTIPVFSNEYAGNYKCFASSPYGDVFSSSATLSVLSCPIPVITGHPVGGTLPTGAYFAVSVSTTGATSWQWFKNGSLLFGKTTPTLLLPDLSYYDQGFYFCVATNSCGSVASNTAEIIVTS